MEGAESTHKVGYRDVSVSLVLFVPVLFLVLFGSNFLQKVSNSFPLWTFETHILEEIENILTGTLIHNLSLGKEDNVVKKIVSLRCRLQKRDDHCDIHNMNHLLHELDDLECRGTVQPG